MIQNSLVNLKNQNVSCIISGLSCGIKGIILDVDEEKITLLANGIKRIYPISDINSVIMDKKIVYADRLFIQSLYQEEDNITIDEEKVLTIFFEIVEGYPVYHGFKNNTLCIKKRNEAWYLFNVCDNEIISIDKYCNLIDLIMFLLSSLTDNFDHKKVWLKEFNRLIKREYNHFEQNDFLKKIELFNRVIY